MEGEAGAGAVGDLDRRRPGDLGQVVGSGRGVDGESGTLSESLDEFEQERAEAVLEGPWKRMTGIERDVYQALIKASAGFHHARRGKLHPAYRLLGRAIDQLGPRVEEWVEQDLAPFVASLGDCRVELKRRERLGLPFDFGFVPRLPPPE